MFWTVYGNVKKILILILKNEWKFIDIWYAFTDFCSWFWDLSFWTKSTINVILWILAFMFIPEQVNIALNKGSEHYIFILLNISAWYACIFGVGYYFLLSDFCDESELYITRHDPNLDINEVDMLDWEAIEEEFDILCVYIFWFLFELGVWLNKFMEFFVFTPANDFLRTFFESSIGYYFILFFKIIIKIIRLLIFLWFLYCVINSRLIFIKSDLWEIYMIFYMTIIRKIPNYMFMITPIACICLAYIVFRLIKRFICFILKKNIHEEDLKRDKKWIDRINSIPNIRSIRKKFWYFPW